MLRDKILYEGINFFKLYHPSNRALGKGVSGPGNDMIALVAAGFVLLIITIVILYVRKKYKQKYDF